MDQLINAVVTIATAIIGVAILAVIVSRNSNTSGVIQASSNAFNTGLGMALTPITGNYN